MMRRFGRLIGFLAALLFVSSPWIAAALVEYFSEPKVLDRMNQDREAKP